MPAACFACARRRQARGKACSSHLSLAAEDAVKRWKFIPGNSQSMVSIDINFEEAN
jgi:hypothetical protein